MEVNLVAIYNWMEDYGANKYRLDEPSYIRMMKLMSLTNKIAKTGRSTRKSIWVNIPSDYAGGEWLNIVFRGDCYDVGDAYYDIQINGVQVLSYDSKRSEGEVLDVTEMLDWLIARVSDVLVMAKNGEYDSYISKVPYYRRRGAIRRTDYYEIVPWAREKCSSRLSEDEIKELLDSKGIAGTYEEAMTARRFYEACAVVYKELGIEKPNGPRFHGWDDGLEEKIRYGGMTPKEWYYATADCRDNGLYAVPLDDATYFAGWIRHQEPYFSSKYLGGHPWDIINNYSYSLRLCVEPDLHSDKCKFVVGGDSAERSADIIRAFLALRREGYAVELQGYQVLTDRLLEKDYLSVVDDINPLYLGDTIAGHFARDEISIFGIKEKEVIDKLIQATEWEKLDEVKLVDDAE